MMNQKELEQALYWLNHYEPDNIYTTVFDVVFYTRATRILEPLREK